MKKNKRIPLMAILGGGAVVFGLWAGTAFVGGLQRVDWQVSTLLHEYLAATGMLQPMHTLVDFYTHIKGIEYLICVAFFVAFPVFYQYLERQDKKIRTPVTRDRKK